MHFKQNLLKYTLPALVANACALQASIVHAETPDTAGAQQPASQPEAASKVDSAAPTSTPQVPTKQLREVSVTASRGGTVDIDHAAATVSVITSDDIDQKNARDIKDALKYEPGVTVRRESYRPSGITGTSGRAGNEGINIRGLEGNQVLLLEDGIALPQSYAFGSGSAGRADYLNTDLYERIEVLRGPTSVLYGSDGLTGAVNFVTTDPADLLSIYNKPSYFSLKSNYDSTDRSFGSTATTAFGGERLQGMLVVSVRHGHETDNMGTNGDNGANRSEPDPLDYTKRSVLGKLVFKATPTDTFKLTAGTLNNVNDSDGLSQLNGAYTWTGTAKYTATGYLTTNKVTSDHVKLDYEYHDDANRWLQQLNAALYFREASTHQTLEIDGTSTAGATASRSRINDYDDTIIGANVVANSAFQTGPLQHRLSYGLDSSVAYYRTASSAGTEWATGDGYPETFPKTTQTTLGAFIQDDSRLGKLGIIPGLRFDYFRMSPHADSTYESAASDSTEPVSSSSGHAISPRLAFLYEVSPALIPYAQYARGFRAPSAYQVNSYYNPVGSYGYYYQQIGNPDLKPETSNSFELGLRGNLAMPYGHMKYSSAVFSGKYNNFIDTKVIGGSLTSATNPYTIQYVNYARAQIHGAEAKFDWQLNESLEFKTGMAIIKGSKNDGSTQTGLDTVPPLSVVAGLQYTATRGWFLGSDVTYGGRKKTSDMSSTSYYATPSFTVVDLHAGYNITQHVKLTAGINNLFDRKYWVWNDVRGLATSDGDAKINASTAPGRNFNVGMKVDF